MINVLFNTEVKEIGEKEVLALNTVTGKPAIIPNDYVFSLIGGERPTAFLESLGINIAMK
jgi:thioredoxin reductase